ncbi:unnamed protein product [Rhizophagus irregularis]|nr:unnamed protein product [Rhizophagus irregularis]
MESTHENKKDKNTEKPIKALRVRWTEPAIKALLSFLLEHKEKLDDLNRNLQLQKKVVDLPLFIQYKKEIEAILNKDRPTLNPKSCINSSVSLPRIENFDLTQENFEDNNKTEITYEFLKIGRKYTNKRENKEVDVNVDNQSRKKSKNHGAILENTIQKWMEQQEIRQIEFDKKKKKEIKGKECLSSSQGNSNNQSEKNLQDDLPQFSSNFKEIYKHLYHLLHNWMILNIKVIEMIAHTPNNK